MSNSGRSTYEQLLARNYAIVDGTASKKKIPSSCDVTVEINTIDENSSECSGILTINGLSDRYKEYKSYFVGQVIDNSRTHKFETRAWNSSLESDKRYWSKFSEFPSSWKSSIDNISKIEDLEKPKGLFMRWKECFVEKMEAENSDKTDLPAPSFSGFYYICLNKDSGEIKGFYYADNTERQELNLNYVDNTRGNIDNGEVPGPVFEWME